MLHRQKLVTEIYLEVHKHTHNGLSLVYFMFITETVCRVKVRIKKTSKLNRY